MSKLLLNEHPLMVMPKLAQAIGLNEAIILQQIHYWNEINKSTNKNLKDGHYWVFNSYDRWCDQFPFWSESTIRRAIKNLEKIGLVIVGNYNKLKIDQTKWYRIDYKTLEKWDNNPIGQNDQTSRSKCTNQYSKMNSPLPKTNKETKSETNLCLQHLSDAEIKGKNFDEVFALYTFKRFKKPLRRATYKYSLESLQGLEPIELVEVFDKNIKTYDQCNYDYLNSLDERIRCTG